MKNDWPTTAEEYGSEHDQPCDAIDVLQSIDQLRRDLSGYHGQLKAHNDLQIHCDRQRDAYKRQAQRLAAENAKLWELCADMLHDAMENVCSKSYWCDKKNWQTCNDKSCGSYLYVERARELGIEA